MRGCIGLGQGSGQEHRPVRVKGGLGEISESRSKGREEVLYSRPPERKALSVGRGGKFGPSQMEIPDQEELHILFLERIFLKKILLNRNGLTSHHLLPVFKCFP